MVSVLSGPRISLVAHQLIGHHLTLEDIKDNVIISDDVHLYVRYLLFWCTGKHVTVPPQRLLLSKIHLMAQ